VNRPRKRPKQARRPPRDLSRPLEALELRVGEADDGARLDRFLGARLDWRSRTSIVELLREGKVKRDGVPLTKKAARVREGDVIRVDVPPPAEPERHAELGEALAAAVLHDDEHVIALAKPAGMVVHPVGRVRVNTLIQALHWAFLHGPLFRPGRGPDELPRICHRLDKDTSGVLVLAKTLGARTALQHAFDAHDALEKDYLAVVSGRPAQDAGRIDLAIGPDEDHEVGLAMTTRPDGLPSATSYTVLDRFAEAAAVRFRIHTGRQHQIRVHARALGHPILLDPLYGDGARAWPNPDAPRIARQALHAQRLALAHPIGGEPLDWTAPVPDDLQALLDGLKAGA
jgi:23S rRNA pseudouridine1911/1915/1917 synthase